MLEVLRAQARGDAAAVLARLPACRREAACARVTRARVAQPPPAGARRDPHLPPQRAALPHAPGGLGARRLAGGHRPPRRAVRARAPRGPADRRRRRAAGPVGPDRPRRRLLTGGATLPPRACVDNPRDATPAALPARPRDGPPPRRARGARRRQPPVGADAVRRRPHGPLPARRAVAVPARPGGHRHRGRAAGGHARRRAGRPTTVPNAWNAGDDSAASMAGSIGWYRRDFELPDADAALQWVVRFESVNYRATVWLNGREIGTNAGAYLPFEFVLKGLAPARHEPPGGPGRLAPPAIGLPALRADDDRRALGRLVELRRHHPRGLPAPGRHGRLPAGDRAPRARLRPLRREGGDDGAHAQRHRARAARRP